ncbi:hypothetical protein AXF42_Ash005043 [Apostasia shenzhenica]|uniref:Uncharacterized protein n=1 Tax=Apostasia shenzhenica TaxID=1088818 RepID=A0A2I0B8F2_9ASPA|nr:hypothetical protein AXF42_Ash005043 [Apostasia shenzhenica]
MGEVAGGTAAGCAAVACCCPCGLVFLALKLPAGLCRRAARSWKKRRAAGRMRKGENRDIVGASRGEGDAAIRAVNPDVNWPARSPAAEISEMERKMWPQTSGTGFWRGPSQEE